MAPGNTDTMAAETDDIEGAAEGAPVEASLCTTLSRQRLRSVMHSDVIHPSKWLCQTTRNTVDDEKQGPEGEGERYEGIR